MSNLSAHWKLNLRYGCYSVLPHSRGSDKWLVKTVFSLETVNWRVVQYVPSEHWYQLNRLQSELFLTIIVPTHKMKTCPHFTICKILSTLQMCTILITFYILYFEIEDCGWEVISFAGKYSSFVIKYILVCRMLHCFQHTRNNGTLSNVVWKKSWWWPEFKPGSFQIGIRTPGLL